MAARKSLNWFQPVQSLVWILFLVWSGLMLLTAPWGIGEIALKGLVSNDGLRETLSYLVATADATWFVLAAAVIYFHALRHEGGARPRVWAMVLVVVVIAIGAASSMSAFPLGPIRYTENLGNRIGGIVPLGLPFLMLSIILSARYLSTRTMPDKSLWQQALLTAGIVLVTITSLEPIAWEVRAYWIWYPPGTPLATHPPAWPPLANYFVWTLLGASTAWWIRPNPPTTFSPSIWSYRPLHVLMALNLVLLTIHVSGWLGLR